MGEISKTEKDLADLEVKLTPMGREYARLLEQYSTKFPNSEVPVDTMRSFRRTSAYLTGNTDVIEKMDREDAKSRAK